VSLGAAGEPGNFRGMVVTLAAEVGEVEAILAPGRPSLRFAHLPERLEAVRGDLARLGIGPSDRVALVLPRGPEAAVCSLAVAACAVCAPLNPDYTEDEFRRYLARLRLRAVIVGRGQSVAARRAAASLGLGTIDLVPVADAPAGVFVLEGEKAPAPAAPEWASADDTAFILLTSGTTSREKLVPVKQRHLLVVARAMRERYGLGPRDRCLHIVPMFHANGLMTSLISPLAAGCGVICPTAVDVASIFATMAATRPTWFPAGYTVHLALLDQIDRYQAIARRANLRFTLSSAGSLDPSALARLEEAFGAPVVERYATSETGVLAGNPLPPGIRKPGTVGTPLCNEVRIVDGAGATLEPERAGEIVVRGPSVFDGYLDDAEANDAAFIDGWYRTGDVGRFDGDGYLIVSGRVKELISRGGEKIGPLEVERVLAAHPSVARACVFGIPHPTLGEEVAAAVVPVDAGAASEEAILGFARGRLAAFKVPRRIFFVSTFPIGSTNKVDRRALARSCAASPVSAPAGGRAGVLSPLEGAVAGLWAVLLKGESPGRNDNFFLMGGDSLRGQQLIAHVRDLFGVELPIVSLFEDAGTVAGMARAIESLRREGAGVGPASGAVDAPIAHRPPSGPMALSHAQTRAWFLARLAPGNPAYNQAHAYRLNGPLDVEALESGLRTVIGRHDILRTTYALIDDEPRQIVNADAALDLHRLDLSATAAGACESALLDALAAEARRPFDLERDPPVRFTLVCAGDRQHVLLGVWHHIAHDGWSEEVSARELSVAYEAHRAGRPVPLPPLPLQYADYSRWQRDRLAGPALEAQLRYWRGRLAGLSTLDLPTDFPRPPMPVYSGARVDSTLPARLTEEVRALGQATGATLFMILLAAFQVFLHRLSGAVDVAVGTPVAGRGRAELEGLVGFFVNTLVLRTDLSGNPRFDEVLARVRHGAVSAYAHQDVPFEKLVEDLAPARDPSRNPLFQVCFALQSTSAPALALDGVETAPLAVPVGTAKFDLTVMLRESDDGLHAIWDYATDLFEHATVERMAASFRVLLESIVADPRQRIGRLALLDPTERARLEGASAAAPVELSGRSGNEPGVAAIFEAEVASTPNAVALVHGDATLTYRELNERANRLAHHLRAHGVGPGMRVGVCLDRSPELIVGVLAILKAGGAYVPLDPSLPRERLAFMLEDAAVRVLITRQGPGTRLTGLGRQVCVDRDASLIAGQAPQNPALEESSRDLAYVMYTSGTTGRPKGVAIRQASVINLVRGTNYVALSPADTVAQTSSVAFDGATFEIWGALLNGARLAILPTDVVLSPRLLVDAFRAHGVTCAFLPTALFHLVSEHAPGGLRGLRTVLVGGETCDPERARAVLEAGGPEQLVNGYGPTETTTFASYHVIRRVEARRSIPIGRPVTGAHIFLLDPRGELVPPGAVGEIHIGGVGVAAGYVGHAADKDEAFGPHPFRPGRDGRVYRTGDLGRWRADGTLEFVGRIDEQVKIRGFRVEPGEVSTVLNEHPAVARSVVIARRHAAGGVRLVAYFTRKAGTEDAPTPTELRRFLALRVPDYMLPVAFIALAAIPRTPSGKVDHAALPDAAGRPAVAAGDDARPRDSTERALCRIWAEVLGVDAVGLDDDFFELGGHSLLAFGIIARVHQDLGASLPLAAVFEAPTVRDLASRIRAAAAPAVTPLDLSATDRRG
jgi:amino acid adenylation domain-containing protein